MQTEVLKNKMCWFINGLAELVIRNIYFEWVYWFFSPFWFLLICCDPVKAEYADRNKASLCKQTIFNIFLL